MILSIYRITFRYYRYFYLYFVHYFVLDNSVGAYKSNERLSSLSQSMNVPQSICLFSIDTYHFESIGKKILNTKKKISKLI